MILYHRRISDRNATVSICRNIICLFLFQHFQEGRRAQQHIESCWKQLEAVSLVQHSMLNSCYLVLLNSAPFQIIPVNKFVQLFHANTSNVSLCKCTICHVSLLYFICHISPSHHPLFSCIVYSCSPHFVSWISHYCCCCKCINHI